MTLQRILVLLLACHTKLFGDDLGFVAHMNVFKSAPETIMYNGIDHLGITHAIAGARLGQQVGRITHTLHAPGHERLGIPSANSLGREHNSLESRATDFVDSKGRKIVGQTSMNSRLARRSLS